MKPLNFEHIPPFVPESLDAPFGINVIVETLRGTRNKIAYNEKYGVLELRHIVRRGMVWPCDFGFIPQTLGGDGDPLDVALLLDEPCFPGCLVEARLLGAIGYIKDGEQNDRLIACPLSQHGSAEAWADVHTLDDLSPRLLKELEGFFVDYQTFEGKQAKVTDRRDAEATMETVHAAVRAWKAKQQSDQKS